MSALVPVGGGNPFRSYDYDTAGNMLSRDGGTSSDAFLYDGEDQLRRATVTASGASTVEEYFYDHAAKRTAVVTRDTSKAVTAVRVFLGESEVVLSPAGAVDKTYAHLSLGTPVARVTDRTDLELQYQGLASNTLLSVQPNGTVASGFVYAPYGELLESTGSAVAEQHRRFNDKFRDDVAKLSYCGYRYYDGVLLGWTQSDPLYRFAADMAFAHPRRATLYAFSGLNPTRYYDPDGRDFWDNVRSGVGDAMVVGGAVVGGVVAGAAALPSGPGAAVAAVGGAALGAGMGYSAAAYVRPGGPTKNWSVRGMAEAMATGAATEMTGYALAKPFLTVAVAVQGRIAAKSAASLRPASSQPKGGNGQVLRDGQGATAAEIAANRGGPRGGSRSQQHKVRQELIAAVEEGTPFMCWRCGQTSANPADMHVGHRNVPASQGGNLSPVNVCLEGAACNLSAGNRGGPSPGMSCRERGSCGSPYGR